MQQLRTLELDGYSMDPSLVWRLYQVTVDDVAEERPDALLKFCMTSQGR